MAARSDAIELVLIRSGKTAWDEAGRLRGATDLPLVAADHDRLAHIAHGLGHVPTIHHPPDEAATETVRIMARAAGGRARVQPDLADPDLGILEGMTESEFAGRYAKRFKAWIDDPLSLVPPEGEPLAAARRRLLRCIARILRRTRGGVAAVVVHRVALGLLRAWLSDVPPGRLWTAAEGRPHVERYLVPPDVVALMEKVEAPA